MSLTYLDDHHTYEQRRSAPPTPYGTNASGYGSRIATQHLVRLDGAGPWRRIYATCFSNAASLWISVKGQRLYLR
jgi:hypothetical protein